MKTRTLDEITSDLGAKYKAWKTGEKKKNALKDEFFEFAIAAAQDTTLEEKYITESAGTESEARTRIERHYPTWTIDEIRPCEGSEDQWEAIIIENPFFKPYSYVNADDGMVYQRQIAAGAILLDEERLALENPELYREVTDIPNRTILENLIYECGTHHKEVSKKLDEVWEAVGGLRQLRELESLTPEQLAAIAEYIYSDKPQVKLAAPRKAKPEELEGVTEGE